MVRAQSSYTSRPRPIGSCTPADTTSISFRFPTRWRKSPSAMGLRHILPVQTKRMLFTILTARASARFQPKIEPLQVNSRRCAACARGAYRAQEEKRRENASRSQSTSVRNRCRHACFVLQKLSECAGVLASLSTVARDPNSNGSLLAQSSFGLILPARQLQSEFVPNVQHYNRSEYGND